MIHAANRFQTAIWDVECCFHVSSVVPQTNASLVEQVPILQNRFHVAVNVLSSMGFLDRDARNIEDLSLPVFVQMMGIHPEISIVVLRPPVEPN